MTDITTVARVCDFQYDLVARALDRALGPA